MPLRIVASPASPPHTPTFREVESSDREIQMRERERLQGHRGWMDARRDNRVEEKIKVVTYFFIWIYN